MSAANPIIRSISGFRLAPFGTFWHLIQRFKGATRTGRCSLTDCSIITNILAPLLADGVAGAKRGACLLGMGHTMFAAEDAGEPSAGCAHNPKNCGRKKRAIRPG